MGRSEQETRRLAAQGEIYAEPTTRLLRLAGVEPGMRVLDVGCGAGDVALQAAAITGPGGSVLGVDEDPDVLAVATRRARAAGLHNVSFTQARIPDEIGAVVDQPVDALVGRLILLHLDDPVEAVAALSGVVRPGGLVTFQDLNISRGRCVPPNPVMDLCMQWMKKALHAARRPADAGERLFSIFRDAGLPLPELAAMSPVSADPKVLEYVADTVASLMPLMKKIGLAGEEQEVLENLAERFPPLGEDGGTVVILPELAAAWARTSALA